MIALWNTLLFQPLVNILIFFYQVGFHNLGLAIISLTVFIRLVLLPLTIPSLKAAAKMKELAPEIAKLKLRYKDDKQALSKAQLELYKKNGANPAAGCLPQIVQLIVLIALYRAFLTVLTGDNLDQLNDILYSFFKLNEGTTINTGFLYLDLSKPDVFNLPGLPIPLPGFLLIGAIVTQFLSSKISLPAAKKEEKQAKKTAEKSDDFAAAMQTQMLYLFPLMTLIIGFSFPSGLVLYWFIFSLTMLAQQYFFSGKITKK